MRSSSSGVLQTWATEIMASAEFGSVVFATLRMFAEGFIAFAIAVGAVLGVTVNCVAGKR